MHFAFALFAYATAALAQTGGGPYPAAYYTESSLRQSTIYRPQNPPAGVKLPVLLWGNGACSADGLSQRNLLAHVASNGYVVFASGAPGGSGSTTSQIMKDELSFIISNAGKGVYSTVDASKVAVAGWSCGGTEAYDFEGDSRVTTIGILDSGLLGNYDSARSFKKPIFFLLGGTSDIAYPNVRILSHGMVWSTTESCEQGERDYSYLPAGTPAWKGNLNVGHGGTYGDTNGGKWGVVFVNWLNYQLKSDLSAYQWLTGSGVKSLGFEVVYKSLSPPSGSSTTTTTTTGSSGTTTTTTATSTPTGGW
jgi:hypothetical protein